MHYIHKEKSIFPECEIKSLTDNYSSSKSGLIWVLTVCSYLRVPILRFLLRQMVLWRIMLRFIPLFHCNINTETDYFVCFPFPQDNQVHFRGKQLRRFLLFSKLLNRGHLLEGKNLLPQKHFFSLRVDPIFRIKRRGKQIRSHKITSL